ncbi:MAG TPA: glutathione peroxidase [Saprospiraceae bacterium]|nr:glutathione peroxidase [Saprospiraceae bacterium]
MQSLTLFSFLLLGVQLLHSQSMTSFYDFKVKTIDGDEFDFSTLKGRKVLIVNTASECGFTPQYAELEELYKKYGGDKFTIIGFPSNDFGGQEPGSNEEIKSFCSKNYGVTFPMMAKITIKGEGMHPLYRWLTQQSENGVQDAEVRWNFHKFLIDENGKWFAVVSYKESPLSERIVDWVEKKN